MTLKEVAARAGVSVSTVSRIINSADGSFARKETQDRVWAVIKETGYMPNQSARNLKRGKNGGQQTPAGTFACILGRAKTLDDNPFFLLSLRKSLNSRPWNETILYGSLIPF